MARSFKVLSLLLSYPTAELQEAAAEMASVLDREALVPAAARAALAPLIDELAGGDLYDLQERYVFLFDRTRSLSLHLFEHVHGESRERGQAMVDLLQLYEQQGLQLEARELPDYLPLFLEFLSILPAGGGRELLAQPLHIISALAERLERRQSAYAAVFRALQSLAEAGPELAAVEALLAEPEDDPNDFAALDRIWEEEAVSFAPGAATAQSCSKASDMLARMAVEPAPGPAAGAKS